MRYDASGGTDRTGSQDGGAIRLDLLIASPVLANLLVVCSLFFTDRGKWITVEALDFCPGGHLVRFVRCIAGSLMCYLAMPTFLERWKAAS
jgi:hypothetical protein